MKHAVVYVPGASQQWLDQSVGVVAERLAVALAEQRGDLKDIRITVTKGALRLSETAMDRARLEGLGGDGRWRELLDIYEVNYMEAFVQPFAGCTSLERAIAAGGIFLKSFGRLRQIYHAQSKGFLDKIQGASLNYLTLFLAAYMVYWFGAAVAVVLAAFSFTGDDVLRIAGVDKKARDAAIALAVLGGGLFLLRVAVNSWFAKVERSAVEYFAHVKYLGDDGPFHACQAMVRDAVVELRRTGYERVDLLAFSLGCVIAGDAIWPRRAGLRTTSDRIDSFATIGYPYDLVKAAYGGYFEGRLAPALAIAGPWWNVTEPEDFLGSNFRNDHVNGGPDPALGIFHEGGSARPTFNIYFAASRAVARSWVDLVLPMRRVVNHRIYWDPADPRGESCFPQLVDAGFCNPPRPARRPTTQAVQPRRGARRELTRPPAPEGLLEASP